MRGIISYPNHNNLSGRLLCLKVFIPLSPILFGWKQHDRWYYGVRYARNCHPDDLWTTYFTSSKHVKTFREEHGEPDVIEVRQTFNDSLQAREWEHKVLRRLKVIQDERWLNLGTGKSIPPQFGRILSIDTKKKMSDAKKGKRPKGGMLGKSVSDSTKLKISLALKGKRKGIPHSEDHKRKISESHQGKIRGPYSKPNRALSC